MASSTNSDMASSEQSLRGSQLSPNSCPDSVTGVKIKSELGAGNYCRPDQVKEEAFPKGSNLTMADYLALSEKPSQFQNLINIDVPRYLNTLHFSFPVVL